MITLIACDLDGTLLNSNNSISSVNYNQISKLRKNGIQLIPVTGRTFWEIPEEIRTHPDIDFIVYSNGAGIESKSEGSIFYNPLSQKIKNDLYRVISKYDVYLEIFSNGKVYADKAKYDDKYFKYYGIEEYFIPEIHKSRTIINNYSDFIKQEDFHVELFSIYFHNIEERKICREEILNSEYPISITSSMKTNMELTNKEVNKGIGFKKLCDHFNVNTNNTIALGDSKNDISLFQIVHNSYAVSNACKELKQIAKKTICSNDEDVLLYLENNLL